MEIVITDRNSGKILKLIKRSSSTGEVIVVSSQNEKDTLLRVSNFTGFKIPEPVIFTGMLKIDFPEQDDRFKKGVIISNMDDIIKVLFRTKINLVVFTEASSLSDNDNVSFFEEIR